MVQVTEFISQVKPSSSLFVFSVAFLSVVTRVATVGSCCSRSNFGGGKGGMLSSSVLIGVVIGSSNINLFDVVSAEAKKTENN